MNHALHRILLINPPHTAIGSRIPKEQLPPLGLLCIGGPLIDEGFDVQLLDAEFGPMSLDDIVQKASACEPDVAVQLRPIALWRNFLQPRRELRLGMQWYTRMGCRVWFREVWDFWVGAGRTQHGPTVSAFWGGRRGAR